MAKKKGRMGKIFGAIAGSPYERLLKQVDKLVEASVNVRMLAKNFQKLVAALVYPGGFYKKFPPPPGGRLSNEAKRRHT